MTRRRMIVAALALMTAGMGAPRVLDAHPLHSTITELVEDRAHGVVRATVRVFADDFGTAVAKANGGRVIQGSGAAWDAAVQKYVAAVFGVQDSHGRALSMRSCGIRRTADLLWICVETATTEPLATLRVRNAMLCDLFEDQVNVVQGTVGAERRSLLFVRGDSFKPVR
ncbi:MAG: DUF6702 family protein [bacterium]